MASKPLSGLTALVTALAAHVLHVSVGAAAGDDRKITFTNFMNSIREATTSVKGFLSGSDKTKLDAIEASADVTDATNVAAAGAVMDSDIPEAEGFLLKNAGSPNEYQALKSNLTATVDPTASDNEDLGYAVGSVWINTANNKIFQCADPAGGSPSAVWQDLTGGDATAILDADFSAGEGFMRKTGAGAYEAIKSNLTATVDPTADDNTDNGYSVGSVWINVALDKVFQNVDATGGSPSAGVWKDLTSGDATALLDADFSAAEGFMRKVSAGTYEVIKSNLTATVDPTTSDNEDLGYAIGSLWVNTANNKIFILADPAGGSPSAVWKEVSAGGGGLNNVVEDTTPQAGGDFDFQGFTITDHAIKVQTIANADWNGSKSFDYANGPVIEATRENPCTPSITNFPASGGEAKVTLILDFGTGSPSGAPVTWTSLVDKWNGGSEPTLGTSDNDIDIIVVTTIDGGTTKLGTHLGTYS